MFFPCGCLRLPSSTHTVKHLLLAHNICWVICTPLNLPLILYHHTFSSADTSVNHSKQYAYIMCSSNVDRKLEWLWTSKRNNLWEGTKHWKTSFLKMIVLGSCEILKVVFDDIFQKYCCLIYLMHSLTICLEKVSLLVITHKYYPVLLESAVFLDNSIDDYQFFR